MGVKLRERKDKGWYVLTDWNGQRKAKYFGKDKKQAKAFADKLSARLKWAEQSGEPIVLSQPDQAMPTVKAYLQDWLKSYALIHCKPTTAQSYEGVLELHVYPAIGNRRLHEVTRADIKRPIATLAGKGLKKQTIHNILTPVKEGYHHAMDDGIVTSNPVARTGRLTRSKEDRRTHLAPLSADEVLALLQYTEDKKPSAYYVFLTAVRAGLREGELIGLQWPDLDFLSAFIEVRRGVAWGSVSSTKSHKIRRVDMTPQLARGLRRLKETRELEAAMQGKPMPEWVFLTPSWTRWDEGNLRRTFYDCLEKAGIRRVRFHDLRRTYASHLIQHGAHPKYIQEQMGHSSIQVTMDIYGHLFSSEHRHVASRLDDPRLEGESATHPQPACSVGERSGVEVAEKNGGPDTN